jgi:hypothetical protein
MTFSSRLGKAAADYPSEPIDYRTIGCHNGVIPVVVDDYGIKPNGRGGRMKNLTDLLCGAQASTMMGNLRPIVGGDLNTSMGLI